MKTHNRLTVRQIFFALVFFLAFLLLTLFLFTYKRDEQLFGRISAELFRGEMSANTLNMHYTLAYPENFDIFDYDAILPCYSQESRLKGQVETENIISLLHSLNPSRLSDDDNYTRALLLRFLDNSLAMSEYPYYDEPLSPSSGMQSQLPILMAEYTFRTKRDVEDYLSLLNQTGDYFASILQFEQEKKEAGFLQPSLSLEKIREQCATILTQEQLDAGAHFLQTTFRERLEGLFDKGLVTQDEAEQYIAANNRLLATVLLPAYQKLSEGLLALKDESTQPAGLASKPDGAAYYEYLLRSETGSYRPINEIKEMLSAKFGEELQAIRRLAAEHPSLSDAAFTEELATAFPYRSAAQMLTDLQLRMEKDFPSLQEGGLPNVAVKAVSPSLQNYCAPAFYLTPPLDDTTANVIYINEKSSPEGLELYTTLAHEGYPGHMYQSVYHNRASLETDSSHVRQILWYGGYLEGWALYVEFISFDYASQLMAEQNLPELSAAVQLEKHNRSLQLCLYSLLDIMIHYDNASPEQVAKVLNAFGIRQESSIFAIYQYIVEEPANYLKYYLGYLEILCLQEYARTLWGDRYSDYDFHTFYLDSGPADFSTLTARLEAADIPAEPASLEAASYGPARCASMADASCATAWHASLSGRYLTPAFAYF